MNKLRPGDRIRLFGGYDMVPLWLRDRDCYSATVLKFFDNRIEKRKGDERLSAVIEFDDPVSFEGLQGKFDVITGRWEGQLWEKQGVVHVYLTEREISEPSELDNANSRWMESHASYECIDG
jgi:hypothetical protein